MIKRKSIEGTIDSLDNLHLRGWVWDRRRPHRRLVLDIFVDDIFVGKTCASLYRADLAAAGIGDGKYGFFAHVPNDAVVRSLDAIKLFLAEEPMLRLTAGPSLKPARQEGHGICRPIDRIRLFFGPMVASISAFETSASSSNGDALAPLFSTAQSDTVPISAFTQHIAQKFGRSPNDGWTAGQFNSFMTWYFGEYALAKGPARLPLSSEEVRYWRAGTPEDASRAAALFDRPKPPSFLSRFRSPDDPEYDWAIDQSSTHWLEDCLVDPTIVEALRKHERLSDENFVLSRFMVLFCKRNDLLRTLPTKEIEDRQFVYAAIILYAIRSPHLLAYCPTRWLSAMLEGDVDASPFGRIVNALFQDQHIPLSRWYPAILRSQGFDVAQQTWPGLRVGADRSGHAKRTSSSLVYDLQIIGPFTRALGLSESCRRLASVILQSGFSVNCVDYDLENTSAAAQSSVCLGTVARARINVIHLNLEEIPEAFAFMPDVFSGSHVIAMPYWELSAPAACHTLGLALVDEIWAASPFIAGIFRAEAKHLTDVGMICDPTLQTSSHAASRNLLTRFGVSRDDFVFITISDALSGVYRKNVLGVVEAFLAAFPFDTDVRLIVKTHNVGAVDAPEPKAVWDRIKTLSVDDHRIILIDETLDSEMMRRLRLASDCLVSLHRAEGLGLDIIDALHEGVPVIATAYSGIAGAWFSSAGWPVSYVLKPVSPTDYPFVEPRHVWAEPDLQDAAQTMRQVCRDRAEREKRSQAGQRHMASFFAVEPVQQILTRRIQELLAAHVASG